MVISSEKRTKSLFLNLLLWVEKSRDSDLVRLLDDGAKLKIPSEINPPFTRR